MKFLLLVIGLIIYTYILRSFFPTSHISKFSLPFICYASLDYSFFCHTYVTTKIHNSTCVSLSDWCTIINFIILILSIPDLKNPGPCNNNDVSVFYQNVQGLIPFSQLSNSNPMLDHTKIIEIHACIYEQEPDIIILNETWLKPSIIDNEIISISLYKVFRCDRSTSTHPIDPDNPKKYRRNGGRGSYSHKTVIITIIQYY